MVEILDIPISNKRKREAPIKTKSALEFQTSELVSNKEIGIESLEDDDEENEVVETTSKGAIMEKKNEIKSSSIQISCEKCNAKIYDLIELIFTEFVLFEFKIKSQNLIGLVDRFGQTGFEPVLSQIGSIFQTGL
ncbi:hypothetical protein BpHYR1_020455 [Brachionus plicatilis]|uniref:Uncharacterized protein n=1 Tax=Brachionus plicatilis TaxID=10195 RepID=A0A3M7PYU2_BRAPC|nr:hypothetical protein BpHYR1_020455 [Brachionus plicatilis]